MSVKKRFEDELKELRAARDELRVRVHLGKLDAKEQWEKLEKSWQNVESKLKVAREAGREVAGDVGDAANLTLKEIRDGYARLRKLL